jgi:hypothetical protein
MVEMNRRKFLGLSIGGIAATAAVRTWPFRVYSFPKEIVLPASGIEPSIVTAAMFDGAYEWIMLTPGGQYIDVLGNVIVHNTSSQPKAFRIPLSTYRRSGVLDRLIAKEYAWDCVRDWPDETDSVLREESREG